MENDQRSLLTRRDFIKVAGYAALSTGVGVSFAGSEPVQDQNNKVSKPTSSGHYNILMIVTDQERHMKANELPIGFQLPGHERLAKRGVVFENHQIASCVCTPSRAVLYTGQHIQNTGMFDLKSDPFEMNNLAIDRKKYGDLILTMNNKLNLLIEQEVGDDVGQMLPGGADTNWRLSPELKHLRM